MTFYYPKIPLDVGDVVSFDQHKYEITGRNSNDKFLVEKVSLSASPEFVKHIDEFDYMSREADTIVIEKQ